MQKTLIASLVVAFSAVAAGDIRADDAQVPRAVIDKALKAIGDSGQLAKFNAATFKAKGTLKTFGADATFTTEYFVQLPSQRKEVTKFDISGMMHSMTRTVDSDKGWMIIRGKVQDMPPAEVTAQKEQLYADWVSTVLPLKDPAFKLASLGETQIDDKPAVGIKVMRAGHADISLYFDKGSGLLVKSVHRSRGLGGKEGEAEFYYSDYKDVDGVKQYTKLVVKSGGKEVVSTEISDFKLHEKLDSKIFAKPAD